MQFRIPASESERKLIHDAMNELKNSLAKSAELADQLVSLLDDNFLSIDEEYRKQLTRQCSKIGGAMWRTNICLYKMQDMQERIVCAANKEA